MRNIKNLKRLTSGFTLVELLIVIGLLGAIALIVIAAINPIEQANRARDTRFKADSGQLISAIDRYFAARSEFPWMTVGTYPTGTEASFGFVTAQDMEVGLCGDLSCETDGELIIADELKTEFRSRDFIQRATTDDKRIFIGKETGSSASVYACFIPLANATKRNSVGDQKVYTIADGGARTITDACDATGAVWADNGCYVCIPE